MKQEWRLQDKKGKAGFVTALLWLCSALRLCSAWTGACLGWDAGPRIQGWRGASKARSSQSHCGRSREGKGLHTQILHKSLDSPCAPRTILQWIILHNLISLRLWGLHPGVFPQGCTICRLFPLSLLFKGGW